eukprot:symbB.v1.2.028007.t1/scaffold2814.1/size71291/2
MEAACGGDPSLCSLLLDANADPTRLSAAGKLARDFIPADDIRRSELLDLLAPRLRKAAVSSISSAVSRELHNRVESPATNVDTLEEVKIRLLKEAKMLQVHEEILSEIARESSSTQILPSELFGWFKYV